MKRKHFSSDQQQTILHQWRESGLTGEQFAHENGISIGTLWRWNKIWNLGARQVDNRRFVVGEATTPQPAFRAVNVRSSTAPVETAAKDNRPIAEFVAGKLTARLFGGAKREDIAALVAVLQEAASC